MIINFIKSKLKQIFHKETDEEKFYKEAQKRCKNALQNEMDVLQNILLENVLL